MFQAVTTLSHTTIAALEAAAERKRERELVERQRNRKVPLSYQQRLARGLAQRLR